MWLETRVFHLSADLLSGIAAGSRAGETAMGGSEWLAFAGSVGRRAQRSGTPVGGGILRSTGYSVSLRGGSSGGDYDGPGGAFRPGAEGPEEAPSDACLGLAVPEGGWDRPATEAGPEAAGAMVAPLALPGFLQQGSGSGSSAPTGSSRSATSSTSEGTNAT